MTTNFPSGIDAFSTKVDRGVVYHTDVNNIQDAVVALETFLRPAVGGVYNARSAQFGAVGNGVADDTTAMQNWLDTVASAGDGIGYLPPGTYLVDGLEIHPGTTLRGVQGLSIIKLDASPTIAAANDAVIKSSGAGNHVHLQGIAIDGNRDNVADTAIDCVCLDDVDQISIRECTFYNAPRHGINLMRSSKFDISGNEIYNFDGDGVNIGAGSILGNVVGNIVHDGGVSGGMGIELEGRYLANPLSGYPIKYVNVADNVIYNITGAGAHGILFLNAQFCNAQGNNIYSVRASGICIDGCYYCDVSHNMIYDVGQTYGATNGAGIAILDELTGADTQSTRIRIHGNTIIYTSKYGIYVIGNSNYSHARLMLGGNDIENVVTTSGQAAYACYGIYLDYVADVIEDAANMIFDINTSGGGAERYYAHDTWYAAWVSTSVAAAPKWFGQRAIASSHTYTAIATTGTTSWLREDN